MIAVTDGLARSLLLPVVELTTKRLPQGAFVVRVRAVWHDSLECKRGDVFYLFETKTRSLARSLGC